MTPVLANKVPGLNQWQTPVDFGKSIGGIRIFGDHKTWRGIVTGTLCGTLAGIVVAQAYLHTSHLFIWVAYYLVLSFGALAGDSIKSFFKRRFGVTSGKSWFPFDQIDYIIGALVFTLPFGIPSLDYVSAVFFGYFVLHLLITYIGYQLGFKKDPI